MLSLEFADDLDLLLNLYERPTSSGRREAKNMTFLEKRAKEVAEVDPEKTRGMGFSFDLFHGLTH